MGYSRKTISKNVFLVRTFLTWTSTYICTITVFSLYAEYAARFPLPDGVFLLCDTGLDFFDQLM